MHVQQSEGGDQDQRDEHDQALDRIRVGHSQETTDEGVRNGHARNDQHADEVVAAECRLEVLPAGDHSRRDVEGEENQNDKASDDAERMALVVEPLFQERRNSDGVIRDLRVGTQPWGGPLPVGPTTDQEANGHPQLAEARHVHGARQPHEEPAGHVRRPGGEGGDERVQAASAKHVIVVFISLTERIQTYRKHGEQINHHGDNEPRLLTHKDSSVVSVLGQQFHQS